VARSHDLIIEEVEGEVLIYDENTKIAHCLGTEAVAVWRACDGQTTIDALTDDTGLEADTATRALAELYSRGLLEDEDSGYAALTRRDLGLKVAKLSAAAAAAPLIVSVFPAVAEATMTPTPAQCGLYNAGSCSGCDEIAGCCCCCQAGGVKSCKLCFPSTMCSTFDCALGMAKTPEFGHCTGGGQPACEFSDPPAPGCSCQELVPAGQEGTCGCTFVGT
jgi:hypothetical protein